jgi:hypothetical protein
MSELGDKRKFHTRCLAYILIAMLIKALQKLVLRVEALENN